PNRYFIELAYHGAPFHGWQRQPQSPSVQQAIEEALATVLRKPVEILGCGRTDTGVHASNYYAHFDTDEALNSETLKSVNALCGKNIVLQKFHPVDPGAHARFDATSRSYQYHIHFNENPFILQTSWYWYHYKPNFDLMMEAAASLLEFEDFNSFCKSRSDAKTTICKLSRVEWEISEDAAVLHISSDRFLRGMVRLITGALIEVGQKKLSISDFKSQVKAGIRVGSALSVPAHGLFLSDIQYPYI
ncbi:MAG: tRNA pseudouridine38-40 synthase, partial [Limisphaerales bacterium]